MWQRFGKIDAFLAASGPIARQMGPCLAVPEADFSAKWQQVAASGRFSADFRTLLAEHRLIEARNEQIAWTGRTGDVSRRVLALGLMT
ncbi:MAG: hypothetical protein ACYC61_27805, partial [Isosphaeraceae bacterium]